MSHECCSYFNIILFYIYIYIYICCLNFWDEAWWFLSLRVFGLLSSSLLLFPRRFGRYVLRPSSGVCWTQEASRNFELRPLLNPICELHLYIGSWNIDITTKYDIFICLKWFPQRFGRYVLRPSSGVCRPREPSRNWIVQQDTSRNGYRRWFRKLLRRQSSEGFRFNPDCRRVTIQEYLKLVPDYG